LPRAAQASEAQRRTAIVGIGSTEQGELPGRTADEIGVEALRLALEDCGLLKSDIDGLITCKSYGGQGIDTEIGRLAGLNPRFSATLDYGACNFSLHLATMAIAAGMATTVALVYGTNQRTAGNRFRSAAGSGSGPLELHGFHNIAGQAAMAFARHAHLYGTTEEQLGWVAVTERAHAQLNPIAIFRTPLTIDDYMAEPYVVQPLRRPDICMISDGGACLILSSTERQPETPTQPVYVLGIEQVTGLRQYQNPDNLMRPWASRMSDTIFERSGLSRADIDVLFIQDPTSVWVCQMLELFGYCDVGESGPFVQEGRIRLGADIPVNTNGGQLSESYMWGWLHLCEAVRQLRGSCGERQVPGAKFAQYCSTKGFEKAATSVLGTEIPS
jgi:acetyl-CoA acetyltransferase